MGGKKARNNFSRNTRMVRTKNVAKKIVAKNCEKIVLYAHEYGDQKMGGKNARNYFSKNTPIERAKNVRKKSSEK